MHINMLVVLRLYMLAHAHACACVCLYVQTDLLVYGYAYNTRAHRSRQPIDKLYIQVLIRLYDHTRICLYTHGYTHVNKCLYAYMAIGLHSCKLAYMLRQAYMSIDIRRICIHTYAFHTCIYLYAYNLVCLYAYTHTGLP